MTLARPLPFAPGLWPPVWRHHLSELAPLLFRQSRSWSVGLYTWRVLGGCDEVRRGVQQVLDYLAAHPAQIWTAALHRGDEPHRAA